MTGWPWRCSLRACSTRASRLRLNDHVQPGAEVGPLVAQSAVMATFQPSFTLPSTRLDRHAHVGEEHFVEARVARHHLQRADRDARALHVDQQAGDALVLGGGGVGAHDQHAPVGDVGVAGPDLLAVDDEVDRRRARPWFRARPGRCRRWARRSPGTRFRRPRGCRAGSASSAPRCRRR